MRSLFRWMKIGSARRIMGREGRTRQLRLDALEPRTLLSALGSMIIDDAVFAHDFEQVSNGTITAVRGPNATINSSSIVPRTNDPKSLSSQHISPTYGYNRTGEYVNTNAQLTAATKSLSYSVFYNARGDNGGDYYGGLHSAILLAATDYGKSGHNFWFATTRYQADGTLGTDRHLWLSCLDNTVSGNQWKVALSTAKTPDQDSAWHQAGFVYQGGATDGSVTFYFDGQPLGAPVTLAGIPQIQALVAPWTFIEDYNPHQSRSGDEYFDNGSYDEAALWTRALSSDEMLALHRDGIRAAAVQSGRDIRMLSATPWDEDTIAVQYEIVGAGVSPFQAGVYLSADESFDPAQDVQVGSLVNVTDTTPGRHTKTLPFALCPSAARPYVLVAADPANAIGEVNENNNTASTRMGRIAFHSYKDYDGEGDDPARKRSLDGEIHVFDFDTDTEYEVAHDAIADEVRHAMNPKFSPDSSKMVFMGLPRFRPDGTAIQYNQYDDSWANYLDLWLYDFPTGQLVNLSRGAVEDLSAFGSVEEDPSFSYPDGSQVIFKRNRTDLWMLNIEEKPYALTQVTDDGRTREESGPVFSQDGTLVAFWGEDPNVPESDRDLWTKAGKTPAAPETKIAASTDDWYPALLDAYSIAFTRTYEGAGDDIYTASPPYAQPVPAAFNSDTDDSDPFAVAGTIIGFSSRREGSDYGYDIYLGETGTATPSRLRASTTKHDLGGAYAPLAVVPRGDVVQAPATSTSNSLLVRYSGANLQVVNKKTGKPLFDQPANQVHRLTVVGLEGKADALAVDFTYVAPGTVLAEIAFDGLGGRPTDTLSIRGTGGDDTFLVRADHTRINGVRVGFTGVEQVSLDGAQGNDAYCVSALGVKTTISDAGGVDVLDFSPAAAGVSLNLSLTFGQSQKVFANNANALALRTTIENAIGTAWADWLKGNSAANRIWGGAGNDTVYGGSGDDLLDGQAGDDLLYGESGNDVLLGGTGNDQLSAGTGRNILIGGLGADTLTGSYGEEILIGGTTVYDDNDAALMAILTEWKSTQRSFKTRADRLDVGITLPALGTLSLRRNESVLDDSVRDVLYGGWGSDWFLDFSGDEVRDRGSADR